MNKITKQITIDDITVSVEIRDRGTDTTWIFLHGWESNKRVWKAIVSNLHETTVTVDLPGFGASSELSRPWTITDYSEAIQKLVDTLDVGSVILVGHSFGGQIAARIAASNPSWLHKLVLVGAAVVRDPEPKLLSSVGSILSPLFTLPGLKQLRPKIYNLIGADMPPEEENLKQTMRNILREDQTDSLTSISVPTKIIWGNDDGDAPTKNSEKVLSKISDASLSILEGGHYVFIDAPERFQQELTSFHNKLQS